MQSHIVPFTGDLAPAVVAFNQRLAGGRVGWQFPERPEPDWLPASDASLPHQEFFLLVEAGVVRGAYCLKRHEALIHGERRRVASFHLPLSEGTIDARYSLVATRLLRDALRREPLLYGVGMRGPQSAVARLVRALGWDVTPVPFYFKVLNGARFARQIRHLRRHRTVRWLLDAAAATGLATLGAGVAGALLTRRSRRGWTAEPVTEFADAADAVWASGAGAYSFCALRDAAGLNALYPPGAPGLIRARVHAGHTELGWAVVQDVSLSSHEHFGDLRLGTLVDALAHPAHARPVVHAAEELLAARGVDVIVSNQRHPAWRAALRSAGFVRGPSTFMFGAAADLGGLIAAVDPGARRAHLNRGDGDGPWGVSRGLA